MRRPKSEPAIIMRDLPSWAYVLAGALVAAMAVAIYFLPAKQIERSDQPPPLEGRPAI